MNYLSGFEVPEISVEDIDLDGIAGLGAAGKVALKATLQQKAKAQVQAANNQLRVATLPKAAVRYIQQAPAKLPASEYTAVRSGERAFQQFQYYTREQVSAPSGIHKLWDETNLKKPGVSNLDKNQLPAAQSMIISGIMIEYGYDSTGLIDNPALVKYENFISPPVGIINGQLTVRIANREVIRDLPLSNFFAADTGATLTEVNRASKFFEIDRDDLMWSANEPIEVSIEYPDGATGGAYLPTGDHYLGFHVIGYGSGPRA